MKRKNTVAFTLVLLLVAITVLYQARTTPAVDLHPKSEEQDVLSTELNIGDKPEKQAENLLEGNERNNESGEEKKLVVADGSFETAEGLVTLMTDGVLYYYQNSFDEIMGFHDGYYTVTYIGNPADEFVWHRREYYADMGDNVAIQIAESFGFDEGVDYVQDLDGDGKSELLCNVEYGADGAKRVYIYRYYNDKIEVGQFDFESQLPVDAIWDHGTMLEYDSESNCLRLEYTTKSTGERINVEFPDWQDMFTYSQYDT